jgi:hypothetical protein
MQSCKNVLPIYKFNATTDYLITEFALLVVHTSLLRVPIIIAICFSNQLTVIQEILSLLRRKKIIFYTEI